MDITLLGTGTPIPDPRRAGPATLVRAGEHDAQQDLTAEQVAQLCDSRIGRLADLADAVYRLCDYDAQGRND